MCGKVLRIIRSNPPQLPDEIIFYILSYLPLSCLFKFKCVCKLWNTLFLHPHLAFLQYRNTQYGGLDLDDLTGTLKEKERFLKDIEDKDRDGVCFANIATSNQGLLLQQTTSLDYSSPSIDLRYRIECPILRQRLNIPNPKNPSVCIALDFVPYNQSAVKLLSVHEDDDESSLGYEILALGVGSDQTTYCWRAVKVPLPNLLKDDGKRKGIQVFFRMGVACCIWLVERDEVDIEVDVLDMVNETYIGHTTFPRRGFFTNLMDWNGRLSFAQLLKDELHVLVLNDYRKLKWDERTRIIKLKFLKPDNKEKITFITFGDNSVLFFMRQDKQSFCSYEINTGKLRINVLPERIDSSQEVTDVIEQMMFYRCGGFYDY